MKRLILSSLIALSLTSPALASEKKLEGTFSDWSVYSQKSGGDTVCFAVTKPTAMAPQRVTHGDIYFMVSNWKSGAAKEQPSFSAGYTLKSTRAPKANIGGASTTFFAADNEAYIQSADEEKRLVSKMRAGSAMTVEAVSARGTEVSYQFSLKGVTAALKKARAACN